jgi:hypothetical protein
MIRLDTLDLPSDLLWENQFSWIPVSGASERTLGGTLVVWTSSLIEGRPIDLVASETRGWLTKTQVEALHILAAAPISYVLTIGSTPYNIIFRYEDAPCLEFTPLLSSKISFAAGDYFTGRIKLLEV